MAMGSYFPASDVLFGMYAAARREMKQTARCDRLYEDEVGGAHRAPVLGALPSVSWIH